MWRTLSRKQMKKRLKSGSTWFWKFNRHTFKDAWGSQTSAWTAPWHAVGVQKSSAPRKLHQTRSSTAFASYTLFPLALWNKITSVPRARSVHRARLAVMISGLSICTVQQIGRPRMPGAQNLDIPINDAKATSPVKAVMSSLKKRGARSDHQQNT